MAKILIVGNPESPLVRERGLVGQEAGHQIFWFYRHKVNIPGVTSFGLPAPLAQLPRFHHFCEPFYLAHAIKNIHPDLIHVHFASKGLLALPLSHFHPLAVTTMGSDIAPTVGYRGVYAPFTRMLLDAADCITVKSGYMEQMLAQIGDFAHKIKHITWGVDLDLFRPDRDTKSLRANMRIPDRALVFFDPRAMRPLYNKHLLLEAFRLYINSGGPETVLLLEGNQADNRYLGKLKKRVKKWGFEDIVHFLPLQNQDGMADLYALADVVISVSNSDGFPQSIYEAWAGGRFMILSDLPQFREDFNDGATARLIDISDTHSLVNALLWVAEHPEIRRGAAQIGRARARSIADKDVEFKKMNRLYAGLLSKSHD
jgi:glycosyltransferase involved in cell wall biosynthesis